MNRAQSFVLAILTFVVLSAATVVAAPRETITPAFNEAIPNIPGKSLEAVVVSYPPGGTTPSHRHPASAFITAFVISGSIRSQVQGEAAHVYHAGESWTEQPGAHHILSENASATKPAKLLAIFVADSSDKDLVVLDKH